ncbi:hypothetical protein [Streptosporangium sp. NPDC023615]|uniref:hypothetical protein n=1 Tax=Streptosporangium sp. NPDC023615 TaxID=3154794 RepID=UPI00341E2E85
MRPAPLFEAAGVVEAPPDRVGRLVLAVRPGPVGPDNLWLLTAHGGVVSGGPERFTLGTPAHAMTVEVSGSGGNGREGVDTIAFQGGWWYRGEYTVAPHPRGTLLTHRVRNVATRWRWGVPLANRFFVGFRRDTRRGFAEALRLIGDELGCPARPL